MTWRSRSQAQPPQADTPSAPLSESYEDLVYGVGDVAMRDFERAYYDRVFVELEVPQEAGSTAEAVAVVTTPDLRVVLADVHAAMDADLDLEPDDYAQKFQSEFIKALADHPETVTSRVPVQTAEDAGKTKIIPNDDYDKAVTCDLAGLYVEYYEQFVEDYVDANP
ncbi:MAG: hypothetical protein LBD77_06840 [Bifidobacteriaceae bacterium]|nr:hypothetical protein [Bifidobacteriaceae bacterium]